jgi:peptidoglycan/LPS O-acetylase OafA/YrhL
VRCPPDSIVILPLTYARAFAAWLVVFYHLREVLGLPAEHPAMRLFQFGYLGVDFFFILSGYILTLNHAGEFRRLNWAQSVRFYKLRFARIYPLHFVTLLLCLLNPVLILCCSAHGVLGDRYRVGDFLLSLLLLQNWRLSTGLSWNIPSWSISTEMASYLLFPLLCVVLQSVHRYKVALLSAAALSAAAALALLYFAVGARSIGAGIPEYGLARCVLEFTLGMITYRLVGRDASADAAGRPGWLLASAVLLIGAGIASGMPDYVFIPMAFALLIGSAGQARAGRPKGLPGRIGFLLGEISYATYLLHFILRDWLKFVLPDGHASSPIAVGYAVSVLFGSLVLYRAVELPSRRALRRILGLDPVAARAAAANAAH